MKKILSRFFDKTKREVYSLLILLANESIVYLWMYGRSAYEEKR